MANTLNVGNGNWATKEDSLLAYNSENGNYKPLPFDFTRASSATVVNKAGLIETVGSGEPRIDFLGNTKGALLLEPSRTNLVTYSEDFSQSAWTKSGTSVVSGFISPDGTNNAFKLVESSANSVHKLQIINGVSNSFQIQSIFVKYDNSQQFIQTTSSRSTLNYVNFDILNKTFTNFGTSLGSIVELNNGWLRLDVYHDSSTTVYWHFITSLTAAWSESYLGTGKYLLIYGAQVEAGSYATSYIPTSGSAVTRVADACSQTPPSGIIGQTEGTVYWEINVKTAVATGNENILNIDAGGFGNTIYFSKSATGALVGEMYVASVVQASFTKTGITEGVHKMALGYANNDTAFFIDGAQIGVTDVACTVPATNRIQLGQGVLGASDCLSNDLKLYNTRLSNSELQALTT